ncbi:Predicted SAM-depedendent methyltransferase [Polaromonas sp. YR568]|uniref:class I SAM-dependent methyltransferase n=1 Tax=Polaromonas sp. YR568 TaxID=1855301 RepID=UPI0008DF25D2|nr:class I SAM-dependent methyltransferase [Polaromonas sp. YR568]SFV02955.1 Predicted SAM-depedendent methyltransferase [Polaromonas sp. YR568]
MLLSLIKDVLAASKSQNAVKRRPGVNSVLNVGGGSKSTPISSHFDGWQHDLLDIDPKGAPDLVCDARQLRTLPGGSYDAVYCSHNLEHYYRHEGLNVVRGFHHILNETGFAEIRVPDIEQVMAAMREQQLELDDVLYQSPAGPITAHDVVYGLQIEIQTSGQDFYAHKTGFTPKSLGKILMDGGFPLVFLSTEQERLAVHALAFKTEPTDAQYELLRSTWNISRPA